MGEVDMVYFIDESLYIGDSGRRGRGIYSRGEIGANMIIEYSPVIESYVGGWGDIPYELKKYVFSYPQGSDRYVIALGYVSIYNHADDNNAMWYTEVGGIYIKTLRRIAVGEEVCINYGESYWSGGWAKY